MVRIELEKRFRSQIMLRCCENYQNGIDHRCFTRCTCICCLKMSNLYLQFSECVDIQPLSA